MDNIDSVLLKASLIHDVIEDIEDFNVNEILSIDSESGQVYETCFGSYKEKKVKKKTEYLKNIIKNGSERLKF